MNRRRTGFAMWALGALLVLSSPAFAQSRVPPAPPRAPLPPPPIEFHLSNAALDRDLREYDAQATDLGRKHFELALAAAGAVNDARNASIGDGSWLKARDDLLADASAITRLDLLLTRYRAFVEANRQNVSADELRQLQIKQGLYREMVVQAQIMHARIVDHLLAVGANTGD